MVDMMEKGVLQEDKRRLRLEMKRRLASLSSEEIANKSAAVVRTLAAAPCWDQAEVVLAFLPLPGEADLRPLIADSLAAGKTVGLPRIGGGDLVFHRAAESGSQGGLIRHAYGMLEPAPDAPELRPEDLAARKVLVLVPGLAFDREGGRLGRGKGFYDRFLAALLAAKREMSAAEAGPAAKGSGAPGRGLLALGVGFACQLADTVPMGTEDFRLHGVATEEGFLPEEPVRFIRPGRSRDSL